MLISGNTGIDDLKRAMVFGEHCRDKLKCAGMDVPAAFVKPNIITVSSRTSSSNTSTRVRYPVQLRGSVCNDP